MQSRTCPRYNSYIAIRLSLSIYVYFINYKPCSSYSQLTYLGPRLGYCQSLHIHEVKRPIILRTYPVSLVVYKYVYIIRCEGVGFLNMWEHFEQGDGLFSKDGLHLNKRGAAVLGKGFLRALGDGIGQLSLN